MNLIFVPIVALIICWIIKFIIAFYKNKKFSFNKIIWIGFWEGKFPSTHSALLSSSWYLVLKYSGNESLVVFTFVIFLLHLYSLLEDKKREEILETYFAKSKDSELKKEVSDGIMREFNGHNYIEIFFGLVIGFAVAVFMDTIF